MINRKIAEVLFRIGDVELRSQLHGYLQSLEPELTASGASNKHHHSYTGGLVEHVVEVANIGMDLAGSLKERYGVEVNMDHFYMAALLHDAGKVGLYKSAYSMTEYYVDNVRVDHSYRAIMDYLESGRKMPKEVQLAILSHMGGWSESGVSPDNLLSSILHSADLISSRLPDPPLKS